MLLRLLADGTLIVILLIAVPTVLLTLKTDFWRKAPVVVMAGLTSLFLGKLLSLSYQPSDLRPFQLLGQSAGAAYMDNPGFPSDHMLLAVTAIAAVYFVTRNWRLTLVLMTLATLMGVARVLALVHAPVDILGGMVAGLAGAFWYRKLTK